MSLSLHGTQTEKNLAASFAGECMARTRYTYFSDVAKKQGYQEIASIFLETAENEREHAKLFFNALKQNGGTAVTVDASVPLSGIGSTLDNLRAAAAGEHEECTDLYPAFADTADKEGFKNIAKMFRLVSSVEKEHENRYKFLAANVEQGTVFKREKEMRWKCRNCGFISMGKVAPKVCPACFHPQAFFEVSSTLE